VPDITNPDAVWSAALGQLQTQMTQATFDSWVKETRVISFDNGIWFIAAKSTYAKDWLENRLYTTIERVVQSIVGYQVELKFVIEDNGHDSLPTQDIQPSPEKISPDLEIASKDYFAAFFGKGGAGYSLISHYASYFWQPYLEQAYLLWKRLDSDHHIPTANRNVKEINNRWSPPGRFYYRKMARMIGKDHPRCIKGGEVECWQSLSARRNGEPLAACCGNPAFQPVKVSLGKDELPRCLHWQTGLLEVLYKEKLVAVQETQGQRWNNYLELQVWRLLPILTPFQVGKLNADLQEEHERWIEGRSDRPSLGKLLDISLSDWEQIEAKTLVPMMPGYEEGRKLTGHFDPGREFRAQASVKKPGDRIA
jgi:hypothetical protein